MSLELVRERLILRVTDDILDIYYPHQTESRRVPLRWLVVQAVHDKATLQIFFYSESAAEPLFAWVKKTTLTYPVTRIVVQDTEAPAFEAFFSQVAESCGRR